MVFVTGKLCWAGMAVLCSWHAHYEQRLGMVLQCSCPEHVVRKLTLLQSTMYTNQPFSTQFQGSAVGLLGKL